MIATRSIDWSSILGAVAAITIITTISLLVALSATGQLFTEPSPVPAPAAVQADVVEQTGGASATCQFLSQPATLGPGMYLCDVVRPDKLSPLQCVAIVGGNSSSIDCNW